MHPLSPETLLDVWAAGSGQHAPERALTLLAAASPEIRSDDLAELSIGERDARLLQWRREIFGERATGFAECPECGARVELPMDTASFLVPAHPAAATHEFESEGVRVRFRAPTTRDLAAVAKFEDEAEGLRCLIERCVCDENGAAISPAVYLRPEFLETLSRTMLAADPRAEMTLDLGCPECGHRWPLLFDIADFLWSELAAQARRLLQEIDVIARTYGWSEREILNLPAWRRRSYVEMIIG